MKLTRRSFLLAATLFGLRCGPRRVTLGPVATDRDPLPQIDGDWWTLVTAPELGPLADAQDIEVVDFSVWRATDGMWELQACIRGTKAGGKGRLLYRWEGTRITDTNWRPVGTAMVADPTFGETVGGLQAPFVLTVGGEFRMFYGDWVNICQARSSDGKYFRRVLGPDGHTGMFGEGEEANARDPMVLNVGGHYVVYYTAHPDGRGAVYARTSPDLERWGPLRVVAAGGSAGSGPFSAECPFVCFRPETGHYFLFRSQRYGPEAETRVYRSRDPLDFGLGDDSHLVGLLPLAAPEIIESGGESYLAALMADLKGIRVARLIWT